MEATRGPVTLQDGGRAGQAALGLPPGGYADPVSGRLANQLVGNAPNAPLIEVALAAPRLRLIGAGVVAWVGAEMACTLDGAPLPPAESIRVGGEVLLDGSGSRAGVYGYLAVAGRWRVDRWRGSAGAARVGDGVLPRGALVQAGRELVVEGGTGLPAGVARAYAQPHHPGTVSSGRPPTLWLDPAPETEAWATAVTARFGLIEALARAPWRVLAASGRVGVRLGGGVRVSLPGFAGMASVPCRPGTVQLAPDGTLLVGGVDGPTMGGYPRVGHLSAGDLAALAQRVPGRDAVRLAWPS